MDLWKSFAEIKARYEDLVQELSSSAMSMEEMVLKNKELARLNPLIEQIDLYEKFDAEYKALDDISEEEDEEFKEMMLSEREELERKLEEGEEAIKIMLLPYDRADDRGAIIEIRAGTGGDEAGLFVMDLFRMYTRYAQVCGWKIETVECDENALGGSSQVVALIRGEGVYGRLRLEGGVHRVQRVPATESGGRIHTSTVTVAVLPQAEDIDVEIRGEDLRIDTYRAQGAGGQHVNKTDSAVRITHIPTGLVSQCQDHKSQHRNKQQAMEVLRSRMYERERSAKMAQRGDDRRGQIGSGDRSERIRTYNFPQGRVTDHRLPITLYKIDLILSGEALEELIQPLLLEERREKLLNWEFSGEG